MIDYYGREMRYFMDFISAFAQIKVFRNKRVHVYIGNWNRVNHSLELKKIADVNNLMFKKQMLKSQGTLILRKHKISMDRLILHN